VRVEIQDAAGTPIPGCTLDDCPEIIGDEIGRIVAWKRGADMARLAGRPVRLRFMMKDADLFAMRFREQNHEWTRMDTNSCSFVVQQTTSA